MNHSIQVLGYASGVAASDQGCQDGPTTLQQSDILKKLDSTNIKLHWNPLITPETKPSDETETLLTVQTLCKTLNQQTKQHVENQNPFLVLGGDHSCAIGTWSGARDGLRDNETLGLIWIDAHMDSHTHETTESGAIHGMPIAALMGYGKKEIAKEISEKQPPILPDNIVVIGARSYEMGEAELLKRLNVRVYLIEEVEKRGLPSILQEAYEIITRNTKAFGVSIDLDAIDPKDAPGTGSPEPNGLRGNELASALKTLPRDKRFLGVEIAEFNPHHDINQKTETLIAKLIQSFF